MYTIVIAYTCYEYVTCVCKIKKITRTTLH